MRIITSLFAVAFAAGCGSSAPVAEAPRPPRTEPPAGPVFTSVHLEEGAVVVRDPASGKDSMLGRLPGEVEARFGSPTGAASAVVVAARDSVRLVVVSPTGMDVVSTRPAPVAFTVAWAPSGDAFAFGFYRPAMRDARPAMGDGDILTVDAGVTRQVGCSTSRAVLGWLSGNRLLVRDTDHLYVVDRGDCATLSTVDARRMHRLTVSPDGAHIVYVHRELVYDRQSRQYVADSTFMIAGVDGSDARTVVNFRYRPERFAWSPDGSELAYDVASPDRPGQRLISIFDVAAGSSAYLHPPSATGPSEAEAHWSPDARRILYRQDGALAVRTFADPYPVTLDDTEGSEPIGWVGPDAAAARLADGTYRLYPLGGGVPLDLGVATGILVVAPRTGEGAN